MTTPLSVVLNYSSFSIEPIGVTTSNFQPVLFGITGASYQPSGPTSLYSINIPGGGLGDVLFLRNEVGVTFDSFGLLQGSTAGDIYINTNSSGNGTKSFNVLKQQQINYKLFYARDLLSYEQGDVTNPINVNLRIGPQPNGSFTANITANMVAPKNIQFNFSNVKYDGFNVVDTSYIYIYTNDGITLGNGLTGPISGPTTDLDGGKITVSAGTDSTNGNFGSGSFAYQTPLKFDTRDNVNFYAIYYNEINKYGYSQRSSNYLTLRPITIPLFNSPTTFTSSSAGITANITNISYEYTGLTGGQLLITNAQSGTTGISNIIQNPQTNLYYAPYFFSPVGSTSIVEPGSYYQYINPGNPTQLSGATFAIPSHVLGTEGITGTLNIDVVKHSRRKSVLTLNNFDYTDSDQQSIFDIGGATGEIYLVSQLSGNTGTLYSGPTGIPFTGATASIEYTDRGPYTVEFPDLGPITTTTVNYNLSFYDRRIQQRRLSRINIPVTFQAVPGGLPEVLNANILIPHLHRDLAWIKIKNFDYLDEYSQSIFGPQGVTGGVIAIDTIPNGLRPYLGYTKSSDGYSITNQEKLLYLYFPNVQSNTQANEYFLRFLANGETAYRPAYKSILIPAANETFVGDITNIVQRPNSLTFTLSNFDFLFLNDNTSLFNSSVYQYRYGQIQLVNSAGTVLQSISFNTNNYASPKTFSVNVPGPYTGLYLQLLEESSTNMIRVATKNVIIPPGLPGITGYPDPNAQGGTAFGYIGPAELQFPYIFSANAAKVTQITVFGELTQPLSFNQKIVLNVPKEELQRMLVYDSAWSGGQYGTGASGAEGGFSGLSGTTFQGSSGFTGPNVGLFLKYVLSQVNVSLPGGFTGHNGVSGQSDRLGGLDLLFAQDKLNNYQIEGNSGQTGNLWGVTGGITGIFIDDAGVTGPQIVKYMADNNINGDGATFSSQSLLNFIPVEAIRSITQTGMRIDKISDVIANVDTTINKYVDPLTNLFEQSVAYQRVTNSNIYPVSIIPSELLDSDSPWTNAAKIYGVDFNNGDSLTFYVRYTMGAVRRYGIDPTFVSGLGPEWQNAPSIKLTFNGKSFDIPIGSSSLNSGLTGGGTTGGTDADTELSLGGQFYTLAIQLLASPDKSNFDY